MQPRWGRSAISREVLQSYRRHGKNVSGIFYHLSSKEEYYTWRVDTSCAVVRELLEKFPDHPRREQILAFSQARKRKKDGAAVEIPPDWRLPWQCLRLLLKWIPAGLFCAYAETHAGEIKAAEGEREWLEKSVFSAHTTFLIWEVWSVIRTIWRSADGAGEIKVVIVTSNDMHLETFSYMEGIPVLPDAVFQHAGRQISGVKARPDVLEDSPAAETYGVRSGDRTDALLSALPLWHRVCEPDQGQEYSARPRDQPYDSRKQICGHRGRDGLSTP